MSGPTTETGTRGQSARQWLLVSVEKLAKPSRGSFTKVPPPPESELESYRIVDDRSLRQQIAASGLGQVVQSPGPGNWKKTKPPAYIMKIYPSFDAPTDHVRAPTARKARLETSTSALPGTVIRELRTRWEQYYLDSRPERRREHQRRADSTDLTLITTRAQELLSEAKREKRPMTSREAVLQATDDVTADFESFLRRKHGDIVVDVFGIPDPE